MATLTIPMPEEDLAFLRAYSETQGISAEALLARQARSLREQLQKPVHPEVKAASGIIAASVASEDAHRAYLETKHACRSRWTSMCCWTFSSNVSRTTPRRRKW